MLTPGVYFIYILFDSDCSCAGKLENRRPLAHECLGEVLRVFRQVITMYPLLNTVETLTAAGKLISKVKGEAVSRSRVTETLVHI